VEVLFGTSLCQPTGAVVDGTCIRQSFVAAAAKLLSVNIYLSTYGRVNTGIIIVDIVDAVTGKVVASTSRDASRLRDNNWEEFKLDAVLFPSRRYELRIRTVNCRSGQSPTAYQGRKRHDGYLFVGSKLIRDCELKCRFRYEEDDVKLIEPTRPTSNKLINGLVSVVIPHYNCPELLVKCLASLTRQTYNAMEVVVVDDGSDNPERVRIIVDSYKPLLPIRLMEHSRNLGAPAARNHGAELCRGEYIFFLDADCELYSKSIERMVTALLDNSDADFAYGGFRWGDTIIPPRKFDVEVLRRRNYITTMSLIRRAKFPGFDERLRRHQDWDLWLTMTQKGSRGVCVDEILFDTPMRDGSISTNENMPISESIKIIKNKHGLT